MNQTVTPTTNPPSRWRKEILPTQSVFHVDFDGIWRYRDLVYEFVRRDLTVAYKQTVLGPAWILLQPLMTAIVFTVIFGKIAQMPTDGIPDFLFYLSGNLLWSYFASCFTRTADVFHQNAGVFSKVYFPRLILPITTSISNLVNFGVQFLMFVGFFIYFWWRGAPLDPSYRIICLPLLIVCMAALGLGSGCLLSALTIRYRDLSMIAGFGVQLWMYASCVVFPLSQIPEHWRWLFLLNPMVPIIEAFRFSVLGSGVVEIWHLGLSIFSSFLVLVLGILVFNKVERTFVDSV